MKKILQRKPLTELDLSKYLFFSNKICYVNKLFDLLCVTSHGNEYLFVLHKYISNLIYKTTNSIQCKCSC